jgi:hypothetical protein
MAIDFPASPDNGDTFTSGGRTWIWNGTTWDIYNDWAQGQTHAGNHGSAGSDPISLAQSQVVGLVGDLAGKAASVHGTEHGSAGTDPITIAQSQVTNLVSDLSNKASNADVALKAPLASPALTGTPTAPTASIGTDTTQIATTAFVYDQAPLFGNRNLLHNGAMQVHQRGTSVAGITASGYYTADRWNLDINTLGTWTQSVESDAPTGSGFRKSLKLLVTTADASPAAGDVVTLQHKIEGQDLQRIAKGTSSAQQLTLSFWVKSNATGTYIVEVFDLDNTRQVSASYAISASATWERKTITFPADTTGAFDNDSAASLQLDFFVAAGTTFTSGTLNTTWAANTNANRAVGQTNLAAATNNYWQITGVQLEIGPVATPFEFEDYGTTLRKCQRYFEILEIPINTYPAQYASGATTFYGFPLPYKVPKRTTPSSATYTNVSANNYWVIIGTAAYSGNDATGIGFNVGIDHIRMFQPKTAGGSAPVSGNVYVFEASFKINVSADL